MSTARGITIRLRVLDLKFIEMVTPAFFQSLSEGMEQDERGVLPPNGHVIAHSGQLIRQPLHEVDNRRIARHFGLLAHTLNELLVYICCSLGTSDNLVMLITLLFLVLLTIMVHLLDLLLASLVSGVVLFDQLLSNL